jgi:hypothetical protein
LNVSPFGRIQYLNHSITNSHRGAAMNEAIASYRFNVEGWNWVYELFPDKLIADAVNGKEVQHFELELKHCAENLDRGVKTEAKTYAARFWLVTGSVVAVTAVLSGAIIGISGLVEIKLPAPLDRKILILSTVFLLLLEFTIMVILAPLLKTRQIQRYAAFKRVSDGGQLFVIHSAVDPPDSAFEDFIAEIVEAIQRQRRAEPPPSFSIRG